MENGCQVFISYRREGGEILARMLYEKLAQLRYDVFYDHDGLSSGPFAETLYRRIDECTDFLVVLSPGGLDRCADPADWVRNEISYAIKGNKNIIPIMIRGFSFDEADLPEELIPLKSYNGIEANMELFPAVIEKLTQKLMHSKPRRKVHLKKNGDSHGIDSKKIAAIIVFILLLIFGRDFWILRMNSPLPFSIMLFGYCAVVYCVFKFQAKSERAFSLRVLKLTDLDHNINEFVTLLMEKDNVGEWEITADCIDPEDSECIWSAKRKGAVIRSFGNIHPDYLCFYFTEVNGYEGRLRPLNIDGSVSKNRAAALLLGQGFNLVWQKESTACYKNGEWRLFLCFYGIRKNILAMELIRGERESSFEQIVEEAKKRTLVGGVKGILGKKEDNQSF